MIPSPPSFVLRYRYVALCFALLLPLSLVVALHFFSSSLLANENSTHLKTGLEKLQNHQQHPQITLLSFNIDGLNDFETMLRTQETLNILLTESPDIIHLQEVIHETYTLLQPALSAHSYLCSSVPTGPEAASYFTMSAVKTTRFQDIQFVTEDFPPSGTSSQGRNLLITHARLLPSSSSSDKWIFINTHLESTGIPFQSPQSHTRMQQLQYSLSRMITHATVHRAPLVLLSGDLNLRDEEADFVLKHVSSLSPSSSSAFRYEVYDLALTLAAATKHVEVASTFYRPYQPTDQRRYDRVYFLQPTRHEQMHDPQQISSNHNRNGRTDFYSGPQRRRVVPISLRIVGNDTVPALASFEETASYVTPSDHRGLVAVFSVI